MTEKLRAGLSSSAIDIHLIEEEPTDLVQLYDPVNCLRCSSLIALSEEDALLFESTLKGTILDGPSQSCHYSTGNLHCPAKYLRIAKMVDTEHVANLYIQAFIAGDTRRLGKILRKIERKDSATQAIIMRAIRDHLTPPAEIKEQKSQSE